MLREAKGWTQKQLAAEFKDYGVTVSRAAVSQWESGETENIKLKYFWALLAIFDTTYEYLLFGPADSRGRDPSGRYARAYPAPKKKRS